MSLPEQLDALHRGIRCDAPNEGAAFDADTAELVRSCVGTDASKIRRQAPDFELPVPGTFVVGLAGVICDAFVDADYKKPAFW